MVYDQTRMATKNVGVYDAKTHLPRLLAEVEAGETVVITRHGKPIAKIVPVEEEAADIKSVIAAIKEFRKGNRLGGLRIKDLIEEGRR
jgi:prevent-host-death family protein